MNGSLPRLMDDEYDRALRGYVAPDDWKNPVPKARYHLVVVGAGPAGLVAAAGAAGLGASVALVERELMGGDCLNFGCVPSKALLRSAHAAQALKDASAHGLQVKAVKFELSTALARLRRLRAHLARHDSAERFQKLGVDVFLGAGRFNSKDCLMVGEQALSFKRALIATGARASVPEIDGLADVPYYTNETIFSLTQRPKRLLVLGGGPIGSELAQAFARLGSEVSLVDRNDRILARDDSQASGVIEAQLRLDGVRLYLGARVLRVDQTAAGIALRLGGNQEAELVGDALLIAAGREPNIESLELPAAGIRFDQRGVLVNDQLRTENPRVYAAGDVCSRYQFTHSADAMARIALQNALFMGRKKVSQLTIPRVTYTSPEVAHVGMSESDASARGDSVSSFSIGMDELDRGVLDGDTEGFARIFVDKKRGTILGATMVAERAGESIGELALAITHRLTVAQLAATIHPYPTQSEGWKRVADQWSRTRLTPTTTRLLKWWLWLAQRVG